MIARIHLADRPPVASGRARGRCGLWSKSFTTDPALATCKRCLAAGPPPEVARIAQSSDPGAGRSEGL